MFALMCPFQNWWSLKSFSSLGNHILGIRSMLAFNSVSTVPFDHPKVKMFLKSVKINMPPNLTKKLLLTSPF